MISRAAILALATTLLSHGPLLAQEPLGTPVVPAAGEAVAESSPRDPYWALIGSYEQDTHGSGSGLLGPQYVRPFGDDKAWFAYVFGTYLHYEFDNEFGGTTEVDSPGVSPGVGMMWFRGGTQWSLNAGLGYKDRERVVTNGQGVVVGTGGEDDGGQIDVQLGGQVYADLTSRQNLQGIVSYGTADQYLWTRLGYKVRMTSDERPVGLALGVEAIGQGNDDITSYQGGGLVELQFNRHDSSVMLRGGYKRSTFESGSEQDGPYFGVNLYNRF